MSSQHSIGFGGSTKGDIVWKPYEHVEPTPVKYKRNMLHKEDMKE